MKHRDKLEPLSYFDKLYILRGKNRALAIAQGKPSCWTGWRCAGT